MLKCSSWLAWNCRVAWCFFLCKMAVSILACSKQCQLLICHSDEGKEILSSCEGRKHHLSRPRTKAASSLGRIFTSPPKSPNSCLSLQGFCISFWSGGTHSCRRADGCLDNVTWLISFCSVLMLSFGWVAPFPESVLDWAESKSCGVRTCLDKETSPHHH